MILFCPIDVVQTLLMLSSEGTWISEPCKLEGWYFPILYYVQEYQEDKRTMSNPLVILMKELDTRVLKIAY